MQNVILEFEMSVKVKHQVVARTMHHFTVEAKEASSGKKLYKAKVWAEELQAPAELRAHWGCRSHLT